MSDQNFLDWANNIKNEGLARLDEGIPQGVGPSGSGGENRNNPLEDLQRARMEAFGMEDTSKYAYSTQETSKRYPKTFRNVDNEELYAQGQAWTNKMINGVGKGLALTGTTFLQSTAGLVNGVANWAQTGKFSSFYDNDFNRSLDEFNQDLEDKWANYYTKEEKDADWYSPKKWFTANFFWDGIIKNMGFSAGAALSGGVYASVLKALPLTSKLFAAGKSAEALVATEEALLAADKGASMFGKIKSISDKYLSTYNSLNAGGRAVVAGLATTGEAGFEAYNNSNEFRKKKIEEYKAQNFGLAPTGEDLEKINNEAENVGTSSFLLNTALLTATNYIQFPKILGASYKAEKGIVNGLTKEVADVTKDAAGNLVKAPSFFKNRVLSTLNNIRPYTFSISEAFEEGAQFAIQSGTQDYYNKKYRGASADFIDSLKEGVKQTLTTNEGMENVLIGGLSGALMMAKGKIQESREKAKDTAEFIKKANEWKFSDFTKETISAVNRGTAIQEDREKALRQGDVLESKDLEQDYIINYLTPRIKYGRMDLVRSDIEDYRKLAMTEEGFAQLKAEGKALEGDTREQYLQRIENLEQTADSIKSLYQSINLRYGNLITKDGKPVYSPETINKMIYAATKVADYDKRIPQLSGSLEAINIDVDTVINDVVAGSSDSFNAAMAEIDALGKNLLPEKVADLKIALEDVAELSARRAKFLDEYNDIKNNPEKYTEEEEEEFAPDTKIKEKQIVKIKTKDGEEDIEVGTEYYLGSVVSYSKDGKEVHNFPKLTILGENEDGTIRIKGSTGIIKNISKEELASYKLGKVSDTEKNKKAKFYMDNINTVYEHYGIKVNGQPAKGRLQYSPKEGILLFVYKDAKGKIRTKEIVGQDFKAKEGYQHGMIKAFGTLTAVQQKSEEEFAAERDARIEARRASRLEILTNLFDNLSAKLDKTNTLIAQKKEQVDRIVEEMKVLEEKISSGAITKKNNFKSSTNKAIKAANRLSRMKEDLRLEIEALEAERDEIEFNQSYVADMAQNIDEFPEEGKDLLEDLNEQALNLNLLQESVGKQINALSKLMDQVDGALKTAVDFALDLIKKFEAKYPNLPYTPLGLVEFLNKDLSAKGVYPDYQSYLQANPNLLSDLSEFERDIADIDELDVIPNERSLEELRKEMEGLQNQLKEVEKEIKAKELILNTFEEVAKKHKQQKEQEARLAKNEEFKQAILGTMVADQQTLQYDETYEPDAKKDDISIVTSTKVPSKSDKPHHIRANKFGNNFPTLPNKANIRGVLVTINNQASLIPGLIDRLFGEGTPEQKAGVIALVMVNTDGELVDVNGEVIPEGVDKLDNAIYQVMPDEGLEWSAEYSKSGKPSSMFRSTTPDNVKKALIEQYKTWRDGILSTVDLVQYRIDASFGILQNEKYTDDKGVEQTNYRAKNSVEEAGLVPKGLENNNVIVLRTTEGAEENGSVTFTNAKGRPLLKTANGLVKLNNRKFNEKEASLIYNMILRLSRNVEKDGNAKSADSLVILDWLKSVVYWGVPKVVDGNRKNPGYNSIWFEKDADGILKLFLSGKGGNIPFGPLSIQENQDNLMSLIQDMYNNVNATIINKSWNEPYSEIIGVKKDGSLEIKTWPNYQSYLLSNKDADGNKRNAENIPLTTIARPLKNEEDVNREGVYFTITDNADKFVIPKTVVTTPKVLTPTAPAAPVAPTPAAKIVVDGYTFDGEAKNNITLLGKYNINFSYDAIKGVFQGELSGDGIEKAIADLNAPEEQIKDAFAGSIVKTLAPQIEEYKKKVAEQTAPVAAEIISEEAKTEIASEGMTESDLDKIRRQMMESSDEDGPVFREKIAKEIEKFEGENWQKVEKWLKENFPNVPVYRVKNVIQATNGRQAWGMFQDGAIYIYENAEVGTVYHEVFEAVWKMFSDAEEQANVLAEFKARKGSFIDRPTGKEVKYSEATNQEAKEQLAEEFRDYVMYKKIPGKPTSGRPFILKLFADLVSFIKEFFTGNKAGSNTEKLFSKIGNGYYKQYSPYHSALSFAKEGVIDIEEAIANAGAEFSIIGMNGQERHDVIQNMTYLTLKNIFRDNKSFFTIPNINKTELYIKLKDQVQKDILKTVSSTKALIEKGTFTEKQGAPHIEKSLALWKAVEDNWDEFKFKHEEYLRGYSIEFDENDNATLTDENNSGKSDYQDARKIDNFKKANAAIKMLLSTVARVDRDGNMDRSTVNGAKLIPTSEVFMKVMNQVHSAKTIEEMLQGLKELGLKDNNYKTLYERLTKSAITVKGIDYSNLTEPHEAQLLASFWKTFKKMNADVKAVFILSNDDVVIGDSNLSSAARQLRSDFISQIVDAIKTKKSSYFVYDDKTRRFKGEPKSVPKTLLSASARIAFLEKLGISFTEEELKSLNSDKLKVFNTAVDGIRTSIEQAKEIATISGKVLDIEGQLLKLATIKAIITTPEFDSTYFNLNGERVQSFIGTNPGSDLYDVLSQVNNLNDVPAQYQYLLTDSFVKNSVILNKMFNLETGEKREDIENYLSIGYVDGTINEQSGKKKESSKLTYRERLIQEINLNLNGYYMNLVPGDASMEWMAYMGNHVSVKRLRATGMEDVNKIFKGYFISELLLSRDVNRNTKETKTRKSTDLRFFKPILGEKLHNDIVKETGTPEEVYKKYESKINAALKSFIEEDVNKFRNNLLSYGIINKTDLGWEVENIALSESVFENIDDLNRELTALNINFMINNIELHKLLYSDPYQYSDELKRIKNFLSPRQRLLGSDNINSLLNNVWNKGFKKGDLGYTDFNKNYFKTTTLADIVGVIDLPGYKEYEETDGSGIISFKAYRNFRIRSGEWNENEELQYKFDIKFEEAAKSGASKEELQKLLNKNPAAKSAYTPVKPIVAGNKDNGKNYNDVMLDKFALYPLSYRVMYEINASSNALKLYDKMQEENIDYVVFKSARKVGAEKTNSVYNEDGSFNTNEFEGVFNVPFDIMSVQSEVPSKDTPLVTRGSQVTKLITMDYMEAGVPVDFEETKTFPERYKAWYALDEEGRIKESTLYKEIKNNQNLLEAIATEGYNSLLNKLHITETTDGYVIEPDNVEKVAEFLRQELLKREVNDNISEAVRNYAQGSVILEATPAYQQIRNILYSIADKEVISPKISGGLKVQIPAALLESTKTELREINGKLGYTSDTLEFYKDEDGKRVCEIMVGRWFKSDLSDEELLKYLNETPEGQKILSGLAYRIPTQKQNSIDVFKIKRFLPKEFGDSVVIPSALVQKVGSDFDIDKLSIYFKNVFKNAKGNIEIVPFFGIDPNNKNKYEDIFFDILQSKIDKAEAKKISTADLQSLFSDISLGISSDKTANKWIPIFKQMFEKETEDGKLLVADIEEIFIKRLEKLGKKLSELTNWDVQQILLEEFKDKMYKESLENEYIESCEKLVSHPKNFKRLTSPNSADQLKDLSKKISDKLGVGAFNYDSTGNMLNRVFMSRLRQAFVSGKYAIGIAAVSQTNHSLNQRSPIYIDKNKLAIQDAADREWLGDAEINFEQYNSIEVDGEKVPTLSMIENAEGQDISDINGQFIDGYVDISKGPWIMELGATPNVASTWLFLAKIGVPIDTIAYFMNQPIVRDYLKSIERSGYSWLFIGDIFEDVISKYDSSITKPTKIPSKSKLWDMIGEGENLSPEQKADQRFILSEFVKYAKMANQLYLVTQGSNFDTASFNDPFLVFKKMEQLKKAKTSIISSVDDILENSFIGNLSDLLLKLRNALSTILVSDQTNVRGVMEKVLLPYINESDRDFVKISQKAVNDLFDWAVQNDRDLNTMVQRILLENNNVAKQMSDFIVDVKKSSKHPLKDNILINSLVPVFSQKLENGTNNLKIVGRDNKVYDQNQIIYAFEELKQYFKGIKSPLYGNLVRLAVLQSGLNRSPISFTSLIPYEDFKEIYNKTLSKLETIPNLNDFYKLGVFQRNNWNDGDVVPSRRLVKKQDQFGNWRYKNFDFFRNLSGFNKPMETGDIPQLIKFNTKSREADSDYVVFTWEVGNKYEKEAMRKKGDYSYIKKGLFKKIYSGDIPFTNEYTMNKDGQNIVITEYIYKMVNAWGDSFRAVEMYDVAKKSKIDNGFLKVEQEKEDDEILSYLDENLVSLESTTTEKTVSLKDGKTYSSEQLNTKMLVDMGYTLAEAGTIIKNNKC
jgi:hypothetical protein